MEHKTVHPKCKKYTLEDRLYQEFKGDGKLVFSLKLRHTKSVTFRLSETGGLTEYDKWGRMTFTLDYNGFWCLRFYDEPTNPDRVNVKPYQVIHKYWKYYNGLGGESVSVVETEFMGEETDDD